MFYQHDLVWFFPGGTGGFEEIWLLPRLAATLAFVVPVVKFRSFPAWMALFGAGLLLFFLATGAATDWGPEVPAVESFLTALPPGFLGILALVIAGKTLVFSEASAYAGRRLPHWAGVGVCLLPLVLFVVCWALGMVHPREFMSFGRIRE
jgi:hypothetical protein